MAIAKALGIGRASVYRVLDRSRRLASPTLANQKPTKRRAFHFRPSGGGPPWPCSQRNRAAENRIPETRFPVGAAVP